MEHIIRNFAAGVCCLALLAGLCGCTQPVQEETLLPPSDGDSAPAAGTSGEYGERYYDNLSYNEAVMGRQDVAIAGQWSGYGIEDPYILRADGRYYLYSSTSDGNVGVRAWRSDDLVTWQACTGEGLTAGFVCKDRHTVSAKAPEVYCFDGVYYMYLSNGSGHHVLTAPSPEGPFAWVTSFGDSGARDGTVYAAEGGALFFLTASENGVTVMEMRDPLTPDASTAHTVLATRSSTFFGGEQTTRAPAVFDIGGVTYLVYSKVESEYASYRVHYAAATSLDASTAESFAKSFFNQLGGPLLLNTDSDEGAVGLGGASVVVGPDLNSRYLAYQSLNAKNDHSYRLDRLLSSGGYLSVTPTDTGAVCPALPAYSVRGGLEETGAWQLTAQNTQARFSAELTASGNTEWVFSADGGDGYVLRTLFESGRAHLIEVADGAERTIASADILPSRSSAQHTVRIENDGAGRVSVALDGATVFSGIQTAAGAGRIGYAADAQPGYTAYSALAENDADRMEIKQAQGYIPATAYMCDGQVEGVLSSSLGEGSGTVRVEDGASDFYGADTLVLANMNDFARYLVCFARSGRYALEIVADGAFCAAEGLLGAAIDGGDVFMAHAPAAPGDFVRFLSVEFDVTAGVRQVRLENLSDMPLQIVAFRFVPVASVTPSYANDLSAFAERGIRYVTDWSVEEGAHYAYGGVRQLAYVGDGTITDFTISVDISLGLDAQSSQTAGIAFRASDFFYSADADNEDSMRGYYLAVSTNAVTLRKCNYGDGYTMANAAVFTALAEYHTYSVCMRGNVITVSRDGEELFSVTDAYAFTAGRLGLATVSASAYFKNLTVSA